MHVKKIHHDIFLTEITFLIFVSEIRIIVLFIETKLVLKGMAYLGIILMITPTGGS